LVLAWIAAFLALIMGEFDLALLQLPRDTALGLAFTGAMFLWVLPSLVHAWVDPVPDDGDDEDRKTAWSSLRREIGREVKGVLAEIRVDLADERIRSPKAEKQLRTVEAKLRKLERHLTDEAPGMRRKRK
jgi:predicted exporter